MNGAKNAYQRPVKTLESIHISADADELVSTSAPLQVKPASNEYSDIQALALNFYKPLIDAQLSGKSQLPYGLGLSLNNYQQLLVLLADSSLIAKDKNWHKDDKAAALQQQKSNLLSELIALRHSEKEDLIQLLNKHTNSNIWLNTWAATIIACASLSSAHLWKSLGFAKRETLSEWIELNFPRLYAQNNQGMRWKRFFYLQLCQQDGDYVCRAPSCDQCSSYAECFLPT